MFNKTYGSCRKEPDVNRPCWVVVWIQLSKIKLKAST